jgi:hypothetical protein
MTGDLAHIARCLDLTEADIVGAIVARDRTKALLAHLAACSAPDTGAAKALLVLARMATTSCDWLDGDLAIELVPFLNELTRVDVVTDLGGSLRERVFPSLVFKAPLSEFVRAVERASHMIAPLRVGAKSAQRLALGASEALRRTSMPPPPIEIAADSLFLGVPPPAVPRDGAEGAAPESLPLIGAADPAKSTSVSVPGARDIDSGWDD